MWMVVARGVLLVARVFLVVVRCFLTGWVQNAPLSLCDILVNVNLWDFFYLLYTDPGLYLFVVLL